MRRLIFCFVSACVAAALAATAAPAKNGKGVLCVLHAKLSAKAETTGSTSTAKGHTLVKVRKNGKIQFKTRILNKGHQHLLPVISTRRRPASPARSSYRCS